MSRIGRAPIAVPQGVNITIGPGTVAVKGPMGAITTPVAEDITVMQENGHLLVSRPSDSTRHKSLHGLTRALLSNAVTGASTGFTRILQLRGVGYRAEVAGKNLNMALGYSHPVSLPLPASVTAEAASSTPTTENGFLAATITLRCHDKQILGDFAAEVRRQRPVEPYKGKGLRYHDEIVKRKMGKAAKSDKKK